MSTSGLLRNTNSKVKKKNTNKGLCEQQYRGGVATGGASYRASDEEQTGITFCRKNIENCIKCQNIGDTNMAGQAKNELWE